VAAVASVVLLARLSVFIVDPSQVSYSTVPSSNWEVRHSCLTAYFVAADVVRHTPNIYDPSLYAAPGDDPNRPRTPRRMDGFNVDAYEYPPPFLLLPRVLSAAAPGFLRMRMLWFGLNGIVVLLSLLLIARRIGPGAGMRALLLVPFVGAGFVTLNTMQKGNVQLFVLAVSMLAMVLLERRRTVAGGALLAFMTVSKLYPGLLVVYLLVRRDWRALMWTGVFSVLFLVLTVLDMGWQPFLAFREHFPGLLSGEAFPAFRNPSAVAINYSIPGLVFKLKLFGVSGLSFGAARIVGTIYMFVALGVTVMLARRTVRQGEHPLVWLTILLLATLRSPFLPQAYAPFPALWLLTLLMATALPSSASIYRFLLAWLTLNIMVPMDSGLDPRVLAVISTVPQVLMIVLVVVAYRVYAQQHRDQPEAIPSRLESATVG
jgi:alpha-1,2-mannosyltransferase